MNKLTTLTAMLGIAMPSMATAFRSQFDFMWGHSIVPPPQEEGK